MLKVIVVDDEPLARKGMLVRLRDFPELDVIAECSNGQQAIETITSLAPDLVFLDVEMPGMDGLHLAEMLENKLVIFCTAYKDYAADAFNIDAVENSSLQNLKISIKHTLQHNKKYKKDNKCTYNQY